MVIYASHEKGGLGVKKHALSTTQLKVLDDCTLKLLPFVFCESNCREARLYLGQSMNLSLSKGVYQLKGTQLGWRATLRLNKNQLSSFNVTLILI